MEKCIPTHPLKIHSHSQWWFASILENNNRNLQFKCIKTEFGEIMVGVEFFLSQFHLLFVNCITNEMSLHFWGFIDRGSYKLFYALSKIQQTKIAATKISSLFKAEPVYAERIYNPITAMGFSAMFIFQLDNTKR